jgi:kanamycin kinase
LPNILLKDWAFSGFIDLGNAGIGDRHIDLFWGSWTLWFNLKTDAYRERFYDAYGRDKIDTELIRVVAAAEVFG